MVCGGVIDALRKTRNVWMKTLAKVKDRAQKGRTILVNVKPAGIPFASRLSKPPGNTSAHGELTGVCYGHVWVYHKHVVSVVDHAMAWLQQSQSRILKRGAPEGKKSPPRKRRKRKGNDPLSCSVFPHVLCNMIFIHCSGCSVLLKQRGHPFQVLLRRLRHRVRRSRDRDRVRDRGLGPGRRHLRQGRRSQDRDLRQDRNPSRGRGLSRHQAGRRRVVARKTKI